MPRQTSDAGRSISAHRRSIRPRLELLEDRQLLAPFTVSNTADSGTGSLRQAIIDSNNATGPNTITFKISGAGLHTIAPLSALPTITVPVIIDGYTQSGASPNTSTTLAAGDNAVLLIELYGDGQAFDGLTIAAGGTTVRGLAINGFSPGQGEGGIRLADSGGDRIEGDFLGTDAAGATALGNFYGVVVQSADNTIGGTAPPQRNVISGNVSYGVLLRGNAATGNLVQGNLIGTTAAGSAALPNTVGVELEAPGNMIGGTVAGAGNVISSNGQVDISIVGGGTSNAANELVQGNLIGTNATGTSVLVGTNLLISVEASANNLIGGTTPAARNLISGAANGGIVLDANTGNGSKNVVQGNYIGTDITGTVALGNGYGISVASTDATIGGTAAGAGNVISGSTGLSGISIANGNGSAAGTVIEGNFIGTNAAGTAALPNAREGIHDQTGDTTIGGTASGAGNVISGNYGAGIATAGGNSAADLIQGNFIGTNAAGSAAIPNQGGGILLGVAAVIGGTGPGASNVISGNLGNGIAVTATGVLIQGNLIGTDGTGDAALPNQNDGILLSNSSNTVGGTTAGARNIISGNGVRGVEIFGGGNTGNLVEGNSIGTNKSGTGSLGNEASGVYISGTASNATIGGEAAGAGNIIAFNGETGDSGAGVDIVSGTGDSILSNSIFSNTGLGIDLGGDGVTLNTEGGPDGGPNDLQNFPVVTSVTTTATSTIVTGTLNSTSYVGFTLQFFSNSTADTSGFGEGMTFLGELTNQVTEGDALRFTATLNVAVAPGQFVSATATDPDGNTSEFSQVVELAAVNPLIVTTTADDGPGSLRAAITYANANPGADTISFNIAGGGIQTIRPVSALPMITDPVIIDGYSEPGSSPNSLSQGDNAVILIEIAGELAGTGVDGIAIAAGNSTVQGLSINGFSGGAGIHLLGKGGDTIAGDFLGIALGADGVILTTPVAWANNVGVQIETSQNTIGGTSPADRDVVSGNSLAEVYLVNAGATGNLVEGDFVGTNPSGTAALTTAEVGDGVDVDFGASANTIGGTTAGARNVLSGNGASGVRIAEAGTDNNVVQGNFIGTDVTGTTRLSNAFHGVLIHRGASGNLIGGPAAGMGNVISANTIEGVTIADANTAGNAIQGNLIGTDASGTEDLGNGADGVALSYSALNNSVGGTTEAAGNTIAYNVLNGVNILGGAGNPILSNVIFGNHLLGIDLGGDGVTPNTPGGPHTGSDDLQNFPVLSSAAVTATFTVVIGTLDAEQGTVFTVQFFANNVADPSGRGQGKTFLGQLTNVVTNTDDFASFTAALSTLARPGQFVTATATDPSGNTSEFSQDIQIPVASTADLQLSISPVTPSPGLTSLPYSYNVTVTNAGPQAASNVVIQEITDSGAQLQAVNTGGKISEISPTQDNVSFPTLAVGASVTVAIEVIADHPGTFTDTASVTADQADPNPKDNTATVTETVIAPAAVVPLNVFASLLDTGKGTFAPFVTWGIPIGSAAVPTFQIYRSTTSNGEGALPYGSPVSAHYLVDLVGKPGTTYYYEIAALLGGAPGPRSSEASVAIPRVASDEKFTAGPAKPFLKVNPSPVLTHKPAARKHPVRSHVVHTPSIHVTRQRPTTKVRPRQS
jgi:Domain of unknown function DUF11